VRRILIVPLSMLVLAAWLPGCGDEGSDDTTGPGSLNHPPVLALQPDTSVAVGDTLYLQASATDQDGDALLYGVIVRQTFEEISDGYLVQGGIHAATGLFWFRPQVLDRPTREFWFTVDDLRAGRDTTGFVVAVP